MKLNDNEKKAEWIRNSKIKYDKNLIDIIDFYLMRIPFKETSSRAVDLDCLGWKTKEDFKELFKYLLYKTKIIKDRDISFNLNSRIGQELMRHNIDNHIIGLLDRNRIWYKKENREIEDLFYYIRCAIAHGRFAIFKNKNIKWYYLENIKKYKSDYIVKARMIIDEKVLIAWKEIFLLGYNNMINDYKKINNKIKDKIINFIDKNDVKNQNEIINEIKRIDEYCESKIIFNNVIKKYIQYDRSLKKWIKTKYNI